VALWTTLGVVLTGLVGRQHSRVAAVAAEQAARREFADSL